MQKHLDNKNKRPIFVSTKQTNSINNQKNKVMKAKLSIVENKRSSFGVCAQALSVEIISETLDENSGVYMIEVSIEAPEDLFYLGQLFGARNVRMQEYEANKQK